MDKNVVNRAQTILEEYFEGGLPQQLDEQIQGWLVCDDSEAKDVALHDIFDTRVSYDSSPGDFAYTSFDALSARLGIAAPAKKRKLTLARTMLRVAAVLVPLLTIASVMYYYYPGRSDSAPIAQNQQADIVITAPADASLEKMLPDSSVVVIAPSGTIRYAAKFDDDRQIYLSGEADFAVVHKADKRSFVINTDHIKVTVYGTKFTINAAPGESVTKVFLKEGSIGVNIKDSLGHVSVPLMLKPGDAMTYDHLSGISDVNRVDAVVAVPRSFARVEYTDKTLTDIFRSIGQRYNISIVENTEIDQNGRFDIAFSQEETLDTVMSVLQNLSQNQWIYHIEARKVIIEKNVAKQQE